MCYKVPDQTIVHLVKVADICMSINNVYGLYFSLFKLHELSKYYVYAKVYFKGMWFMRLTARMVVNPIMIDKFASLFNNTNVPCSICFRRLAPDYCCCGHPHHGPTCSVLLLWIHSDIEPSNLFHCSFCYFCFPG